MKLHGANHGATEPLTGIDIAVLPSNDLLIDISELPKGSKIAIESFPEIIYANKRKNGFNLPDERIAYWKSLVRFCENIGHQVVYVDDYELNVKANDYINQHESIFADFSNKFESLSSDEKRTITRKMLALRAMLEYVNVVEREKEIFENIISASPDMAIIGKAHADYLFRSEYKDRIPVEKYSRSNDFDPLFFDDVHMFEVENSRKYENPVLIDQLAKKEEAFREFLIRRKNAYTKGRILPEKTADWIGSWAPKNIHEGLFEIYFYNNNEGGEISGTVEDILGTAVINGRAYGDNIEFIKQYIPEKTCSQHCAHGEIKYFATMCENGEYNGQWISYDNSGEFILRKGSTLFLPEELYKSDI